MLQVQQSRVSEVVNMSSVKLVHHSSIRLIGNKNSKRFKGVERDGEKICTRCRVSKLLNMFGSHKLGIFGKNPWCRVCVSKSSKYYHAKITGRTVEQVRIIAENIKARTKVIDGKKLCSKCNQWKLVNSFYKNKYNNTNGLNSLCIKCHQVGRFKENRRIKLICMIGYGGKCVCCGETKIEMLTIEHIRYKGHELIHESCTLSLMKKLIRLKFPEGHTILCYNCNLSTKYGKLCVHSPEYDNYYNKNIVPYKYAKQAELDALEQKWAEMNGG